MPLPATVLVVEDEQDQMVWLTHVLSGAGFRVVQAYGGEDAIRKLKERRVDLVVTDLAMPKVTGVEVIEVMRADPTLKHIPVVVVTAHTWETLVQSAGHAGFDGMVSKPFTAKRLLQEVYKHLKPCR